MPAETVPASKSGQVWADFQKRTAGLYLGHIPTNSRFAYGSQIILILTGPQKGTVFSESSACTDRPANFRFNEQIC